MGIISKLQNCKTAIEKIYRPQKQNMPFNLLYHTFGTFSNWFFKASLISFLNFQYWIQLFSNKIILYISIVCMLLCTECDGNQSQESSERDQSSQSTQATPTKNISYTHSYYNHFTYPDTSLHNPDQQVPYHQLSDSSITYSRNIARYHCSLDNIYHNWTLYK